MVIEPLFRYVEGLVRSEKSHWGIDGCKTSSHSSNCSGPGLWPTVDNAMPGRENMLQFPYNPAAQPL